MANTYTQCYFHLVFAVKNRDALIRKEWKDELEKYITGIVQNHRHKMLAIGSMPDHIHILIGYNLNHLIPDLVEEIKTSSNSWIKVRGYPNLNLSGRKVMVLLHTRILRLILLLNIFYPRKNIIGESDSKKNIWSCLKRTILNLKMNTFLNSLVILMIGNKYYGALHLW